MIINVLQNLIGRICLAYLDTGKVVLKRRPNRVNDLKAVLDRIPDAGLKRNPAKLNFVYDQVLYLGHVIFAAVVCPDSSKLRVLVNWPLPTTVCELQSFFGVVHLYNKFIDEQTALTASLYNKIAVRKGT